MESLKWLYVVAVLTTMVPHTLQHGRLLQPPSRASAWRYGYDVPVNTNDNQLNCGGFGHQWGNNEGKCGECGDAYDIPLGQRPHQVGGQYATGTITGTYSMGQMINVLLQITAQHHGWYEFRLCPVNDKDTPVTWECLNQTLLEFADGTTRHYIPASAPPGNASLSVKLPDGLSCSQCVLQWLWHCGNSWGTDPDGTSCTGCGPQEQFYGCSDITILGNGETPAPTESTSATTTSDSTTSSSITVTFPTSVTTTSAASPTTTTAHTGKDCEWIGGSDGDDGWCDENCNHMPPNCPPEKCQCTDV